MKLRSFFEDNVMLSAIKKNRGKATIIALLLVALSGCSSEDTGASQDSSFENKIEAARKAEEDKKAREKEYALKRAFGLLLNAKGSGGSGELDNAQVIFNREHGGDRYSFFKELIPIAGQDTAAVAWITRTYLDNVLYDTISK